MTVAYTITTITLEATTVVPVVATPPPANYTYPPYYCTSCNTTIPANTICDHVYSWGRNPFQISTPLAQCCD